MYAFDALFYPTQLDYVHKEKNRMFPTDPTNPHPELRFSYKPPNLREKASWEPKSGFHNYGTVGLF